jgi:hypothetical protein
MKQTRIPWSILSAFLITFFYWIYRFSGSFSSDLIDYQALGRILAHQGITGFLVTGPHREPIYPLLCAWAMNVENLSGISFTHIMASFGILMLLATQMLAYTILKDLNIRTGICSLAILYLGISPALTNSAFNVLLFCEIVTYPFILMLVIAGRGGWEALKQNNISTACGYGALMGFTFTVLTFVKAVFECIGTAYLMIFLAAAVYKKKASFSLVCFLAVAGMLFYIPTVTYKFLNKIYNGNFCIADRGPLNLYGNVERRIEPLTFRKYFADLASGAGVCEVYFKPQECYFWTFNESDSLGSQKTAELIAHHLPPQGVTDALIRLSIEKALNNFPHYFLLTVTEGFRMFFWEATTPFVPLNFIMAVLTFFAFFNCCFYLKDLPNLMGHVLAIIFLFVFFYSFFAILPRHILPMVPLYVISISYSFSQFFRKSSS